MAPEWPSSGGQLSENVVEGHTKWDFLRLNPLVVTDPSHLGPWHRTEAGLTGVAGLYTRGRTCLQTHSQNPPVILLLLSKILDNNTVIVIIDEAGWKGEAGFYTRGRTCLLALFKPNLKVPFVIVIIDGDKMTLV